MDPARRSLLGYGSLLVASAMVSWPRRVFGDGTSLNVRAAGAKGGGKPRDTAAIQAVFDAAGQTGERSSSRQATTFPGRCGSAVV
jgi:hypothetical protein